MTTDLIREALDILDEHKTPPEACFCCRCKDSVDRAVASGFTCEICGFGGRPAAIECSCYEFSCAGSGSNGAGCPHGGITCPVCSEGEGDQLSWEQVKRLRAILQEACKRELP